MSPGKRFFSICGVMLLAGLNIWFLWEVNRLRTDPAGVVVFDKLECGHWALIRCCHLLGLPMSPEDAVRSLPPRRSQGHTLLDLKTSLEALGFEVEPRFQSLDDALTQELSGRPVILHLTKPDHFVVLSRQSGGTAVIFDATGQRRKLPLDTIRQRFDGYSLIIKRPVSDQPLPLSVGRDTQSSPCLQFDTIYLDKGDIPVQQTVVTYEFPVRNLGAKPLHLTSLSGDCSCLQVDGPGTLQPFSSGIIRARFTHQPRQTRSTFEHEIRVESDDPLLPVVSLIAAGNTNTSLYALPLAVEFGSTAIGQRQIRRCFVQYNGQDETVLESARYDCTVPDINMRILTREQYLAEHPLGQGLTPERTFPGQVRVVELVWSPTVESAAPGLSGILRISPQRSDITPLEIPLSGNVSSTTAGGDPPP